MIELWTIAELAAALKVKPKTVSNMISNGTFREGVHFVRPPGLGTRFKQQAVESWLNRTDRPAAPAITFPVRNVVNADR